MKKAILILLTLLLSLTTLIGCTSPQTTDDSSKVNNQSAIVENTENFNSLIGTWIGEISDSDKNAMVAYQFLANGTVLTTRLLKVSESQYGIDSVSTKDYRIDSMISEFTWYTGGNVYVGPLLYLEQFSSKRPLEYRIIDDTLTLSSFYENDNTRTIEITNHILNRYNGNIFEFITEYIPVGSTDSYTTPVVE